MKSSKKSRGTIKKVLSYIGKYRIFLFITILLAALTVALTLVLPVLIGDAIDFIIDKGNVDFDNITRLSIICIGIIVVTALFQWIMNVLCNKITFGVVRDVRSEAFGRLEKLPISYLDKKASGDVVSRIISDADQFADGLLMGFTNLFTGIATIVGTLAIMLFINWKIALVVFCLTPISLLVARFIATRTYSMFKLQASTRSEQTQFIDEMIGNQKVVRSLSHEEENQEVFDEINDRLAKCSLKAIFFSSLTNPCTRFVNSLVYAAVAITGALAVLDPKGIFAVGAATFTVGNLSSFLAFANQYTKPFNNISSVVTELQNSVACAERLFELIEEPIEVENATDTLESVQGRVTIDNVSFSYVKERPLIESFCLDVKPGQKIAIVGPTGCGKTTMINLLMRFYDVNSGAISVDGRDITKITRHDLRKNYGMVLQETWLKSGTIRDNIVMGKPDATDEEIIAAAKATHAHGFITRLSKGYDTVIGEDGGSLSQGQKQLLCITRIMLASPPMLILDEATSSIDTRTEIRVQRAFDKLMKGRTSFIVAHRLSTIREADVIVVMKDGHVIETGNHDELLNKKGFYSELYNSQFAT